MKTNKTIFALLAFFIISILPAQVNLNDYKYVSIPNKFEFLKEANQYRLNELTQFLFQKHGFTTIMEEDVLPKDAINNGCLVLNADVLNDSGMFKTKLKVELKNCNGEIVFSSLEGTSRDKKYNVAYNEALRGAFKSFEVLNYKYVPNEKAIALAKVEDEKEEEIKKLKEKIKELKETETKTNVKIVEKAKEVIKKPVIKETTKEEVVEKAITNNILYAQPKNTGFQLVDTTPKVIYTIFPSGREGVYIVKGIDAIIYKETSRWIIAEQKGNSLEKKTLNIKF